MSLKQDPVLRAPAEAGIALRRDDAKRLGIASAYLALFGLTVSPLLWARIPALVDYPNHLARMWILVHGAMIPELARNYVVSWRLVPNLAMDLVVPTLAHIMPLEAAGRVFIALTMALLVVGSVALHRALYGRVGLWPLCSFLFIYNAALYWGFLNCLFATGLYLLAFASWIGSRDWPFGRRFVAFSILSTAILVCHLFAFGLYALSVAFYELQSTLQNGRLSLPSLRGWITSCLHLAPAAALWRISAPADAPSFTFFGSVPDKFYAFIAPATFGEHPALFDGAMVCFVYLVLYGLVRNRSLSVAPSMRLPLAILLVVTLVIPNWLNGSWAADMRLPVALPFITIGASRCTMRGRAQVALATVALILLAVRIWTVSATWHAYDKLYAEFRKSADVVDPGSRLLVVEERTPDGDRALSGIPPEFAQLHEPNFWHMPALAVIDRSAFIPYLFTGLTTIHPTARNAGLFETQGGPLTPAALWASASRRRMGALATTPNILGELPYSVDWPKHFDFVLWIDFGQKPAIDPTLLQPLAVGSFFQIYRIAKP